MSVMWRLPIIEPGNRLCIITLLLFDMVHLIRARLLDAVSYALFLVERSYDSICYEILYYCIWHC